LIRTHLSFIHVKRPENPQTLEGAIPVAKAAEFAFFDLNLSEKWKKAEEESQSSKGEGKGK